MLEEYLSGCKKGKESISFYGGSNETSTLICEKFQNDSFGTQENSCKDDDDDDDGQRFPVCDLMQEFEKVSVQKESADEESWDKCRRVQTEDDSSEDYFTADEDDDNINGRCSPVLISSSRRHIELETSSSSGSSFKSTHSTSDLLPHTQDSFILG